MSKSTMTPSVIFYKRMIAATLAFIILTLTILVVVFGVRLHRTNKALREAEDKLQEIELAELQKRAAEEAERLRNAIPPEQEKPEGERNAEEILADNTIIAHALGSVDGVEGLNCLEGFYEHYRAGVRVFEADLRMTADGAVVLRHDWNGGLQEDVDPMHIPTLDEFLSKLVPRSAADHGAASGHLHHHRHEVYRRRVCHRAVPCDGGRSAQAWTQLPV